MMQSKCLKKQKHGHSGTAGTYCVMSLSEEINSVGMGTRVNGVAVDDVGEPVSGANADTTARPEGRDTAKKRRARPCEEDSVSSAAIEVLSAMNARGQVKDDKEDTQMAQIL